MVSLLGEGFTFDWGNILGIVWAGQSALINCGLRPTDAGFFFVGVTPEKQAAKGARAARLRRAGRALLNFGFCIGHMLADNGIELLDLHFVWHVLLILGRGVKVACPCRGY